ncbi:hypothetical protein B0H13DRAFT_2523692 [Mycena leptocephala]|nr:hypothetical protein B0H13DRAFT_2523692 [Mycena leptocephala]
MQASSSRLRTQHENRIEYYLRRNPPFLDQHLPVLPSRTQSGPLLGISLIKSLQVAHVVGDSRTRGYRQNSDLNLGGLVRSGVAQDGITQTRYVASLHLDITMIQTSSAVRGDSERRRSNGEGEGEDAFAFSDRTAGARAATSREVRGSGVRRLQTHCNPILCVSPSTRMSFQRAERTWRALALEALTADLDRGELEGSEDLDSELEGCNAERYLSYVLTPRLPALVLFTSHTPSLCPSYVPQSPPDQRKPLGRQRDETTVKSTMKMRALPLSTGLVGSGTRCRAGHRARLQDPRAHDRLCVISRRERFESYRTHMDLGGCTSPRCMTSARVFVLVAVTRAKPCLPRCRSIVPCPRPAFILTPHAPAIRTSWKTPPHNPVPVHLPADVDPLLRVPYHLSSRSGYDLLSSGSGQLSATVHALHAVLTHANSWPDGSLLAPHILILFNLPLMRGRKILVMKELLQRRNVPAAKVRDKLEQRIEWKGYERVVGGQRMRMAQARDGWTQSGGGRGWGCS